MIRVRVKHQRRFARGLKRISKDVEIEVSKIARKLAFDIFAEVVAGTPVATGRAMNNWNISLGTPDRSVREVGGSEGTVRAAKAAEALSELTSFRLGQTIWISNSVPYIVSLEEGSSRQAPNGWIARAVINNVNALGAI